MTTNYTTYQSAKAWAIPALRRRPLDQPLKDSTRQGLLEMLEQNHVLLEQARQRIAAQEDRIAELEQLATTDTLTGIKNRRGFMEIFSAELDRCTRRLSSGGLLVMIDLDNFKTINDTYGHAAGDACLRLVAHTLDSAIRTMDSAARLGGDEFVLLLSNTTKCDVAARAQELGRQLNNLALAWHGEEIPVQASLGLQSYEAGDKLEKIFSAADKAMYDEKALRRAAQQKEYAAL